jgi:hypothetical protein
MHSLTLSAFARRHDWSGFPDAPQRGGSVLRHEALIASERARRRRDHPSLNSDQRHDLSAPLRYATLARRSRPTSPTCILLSLGLIRGRPFRSFNRASSLRGAAFRRSWSATSRQCQPGRSQSGGEPTPSWRNQLLNRRPGLSRATRHLLAARYAPCHAQTPPGSVRKSEADTTSSMWSVSMSTADPVQRRPSVRRPAGGPAGQRRRS